jgi:hypothetical protein
MTYKSNLPAVENALRRGIDAGLTAAAQNLHAKIRTRLLHGYTTGNFAHQMRGVAGRVVYTTPFDYNGGRAVSIGTGPTQVPYELYWEMGHRNVFTRRYDRVEVWQPIMRANADLAQAIIARNVARFTQSVATAPAVTLGFRLGGGAA